VGKTAENIGIEKQVAGRVPGLCGVGFCLSIDDRPIRLGFIERAFERYRKRCGIVEIKIVGSIRWMRLASYTRSILVGSCQPRRA
jgi:hypothetical protein